MSGFKITQSNAICLLVALGFKTAGSWTPKKISDKLLVLEDYVTDETSLDPANTELLNGLLAAVREETKIILAEDSDDEDTVPVKAKKETKAPAKGKKAAPKEEVEEDEEEEEAPVKSKKSKSKKAAPKEEVEDEEEEAPVKSKKSKGKEPAAPTKGKKAAPKEEVEEDDEDTVPVKAKKSKGKKGEGVCSVITAILLKASERKPILKETILKQLVERFPERNRTGMANTIRGQLSILANSGEYRIGKKDKGYWAEQL